MDNLVYEYIKYLSRLDSVIKPKMPTFPLAAYTESEYLLAISEIMQDYDKFDDLSVSLEFLRERDGN